MALKPLKPKTLHPTTRKLIDELIVAADTHAFKGAIHPDGHAEIEKDLADARKKLEIHILKLRNK